MSNHYRAGVALVLMAFVGATPGQQIVSAPGPTVLARDLKQLRAPPVQAVLWTRRAEMCTLQVVLARPGPGARTPSTSPAPRAEIDAWLVRADGSVLNPIRRWENSSFHGPASPVATRGAAPELLIGFPLEAGKEVVTVVMKVNGTLYSEQVMPFTGGA